MRDGTTTGDMNALILMSGGIDSAACAHFFLKRGHSVEGVFIDYGQPAAHAEFESVKHVTAHLNIGYSRLYFRGISPFGSGEVMGRNAFLVFSTLMGMQPSKGILSLGIHAGTLYYDCGTDFVDAVAGHGP